MFDFAGLFLVAILARNLYTGDPCEGVWGLLPQTKNPRYGPAVMQIDGIISGSMIVPLVQLKCL